MTLMKTLKKYVGHISCQNQNRIIRNCICFIKKMWSTFTRLSCLNWQYITLMWQISFLVYYWNCKAQLWSWIMNLIYSTQLQTDTLKSVENSRCEMLANALLRMFLFVLFPRTPSTHVQWQQCYCHPGSAYSRRR